MGTIAARKANEILGNVRKVIAMEILAACQGIDLRDVKRLGKGTNEAHTLVREIVEYYDKDRVMYIDIEKVEELIKTNKIVEKVEENVGKLKI